MRRGVIVSGLNTDITSQACCYLATLAPATTVVPGRSSNCCPARNALTLPNSPRPPNQLQLNPPIMSNGAEVFCDYVDVTQCLPDEELQGNLPDREGGPASSQDNDYQALTYFDLYQGRNVPSLHQILPDFPAPSTYPSSSALDIPMPLSLGNTSLDGVLFDGFVHMTDASSSDYAEEPPVEHISPLMLSLPMAPATSSSETESTATSKVKLRNNTSRDAKRPRSSTESTGDRAPKRTRTIVDCRPACAAADLAQVEEAPAVGLGFYAEESRCVSSTAGHNGSDGGAVALAFIEDVSETEKLCRDSQDETLLLSPHPSAGRRQSPGDRRKPARHADDDEYLPPQSAKRKTNPNRPPPRKKQEPAPRQGKQLSRAKGKVTKCPVPKCLSSFCRADDLERHLRSVKKPDHLDMQLYCTHPVHRDTPEKQSRVDTLFRHLQDGRCMGAKELHDLAMYDEEAKLSDLATRKYGKWVLHCRNDRRYTLLKMFKEITDVQALEAQLAESAEIIFRCQCCEAARPNWAWDGMENFGSWDWDEDSQALQRRNAPFQ
ncbi:hypothetical protein K466DRAFT_266209 [Polyporus arcularius HHB13444]|uniref:Uncharacterized protein n=1 Tax=Polyporus arcularius HHB13444 TaxID=1314778 RepID=A0A5C3Q0R9_9APHY|nr:hypothetical protein K466DRAFT_266209 [Polyporus arcularius HHB13444]